MTHYMTFPWGKISSIYATLLKFTLEKRKLYLTQNKLSLKKKTLPMSNCHVLT